MMPSQFPSGQLALLALAALLTPLTTAQDYQYDQRTTPDCIEWANIANATLDTCESTLRFWGVEPVRFHAWNPSVGLDCTPWFSQTSYCILTNATLEDSVFYTTTAISEPGGTYSLPLASMTTDSAGWRIPVTRSDAPARTTSTRAPIPSPSTWKDTGCFVNPWNEDYELPRDQWVWILDFRFADKDPYETADKCKFKCWQIQYPIAGVKGGDMCYCGDRNNGTLAASDDECNRPCVGAESVNCGGVNRTRVFEAEGYGGAGASGSASGSVSLESAGSAAGSRTSGAGAAATASSGAVRNAVLFGLWGF